MHYTKTNRLEEIIPKILPIILFFCSYKIYLLFPTKPPIILNVTTCIGAALKVSQYLHPDRFCSRCSLPGKYSWI